MISKKELRRVLRLGVKTGALFAKCHQCGFTLDVTSLRDRLCPCCQGITGYREAKFSSPENTVLQ
jgi:hypothetical protein